jgi:hypothetical protein
MGNAKALFVAHNDEDYAHVHIVARRSTPTDRGYDLEKSYRKLSKWAEAYEREHGGIQLRRFTGEQLGPTNSKSAGPTQETGPNCKGEGERDEPRGAEAASARQRFEPHPDRLFCELVGVVAAWATDAHLRPTRSGIRRRARRHGR